MSNKRMWARHQQKIYFDDPDMDYYFHDALSRQSRRGSEFGECFYIASQIKEGDPESWANEWIGYATRVQSIAEHALEKGHVISARDAFLRAYSYYRLGLMTLLPAQDINQTTYDSMRHCFRKMAEHASISVVPVEAPFEGSALPGYALSPKDGDGRRPTILMLNPGELYSEDCYSWIGMSGVERGYNVFSFDGPGGCGLPYARPEIKAKNGPDFYEFAIKLIDFVLARPEVDPEHFALFGFSGTGWLSTGVASMDKRVRALVASAPIYSMHQLASSEFPKTLQKAPAFVQNAALKLKGATSPFTNVAVQRLCHHLNLESVAGLLGRFEGKDFDPSKITCPVLGITGEGESEEQRRQAQFVVDSADTSVKKLHIFRREDGADAHCQYNNFTLMNQVAYDWLDEVFA